MEQEQININGIEFRGIRLKTQHGTILLVQGAKANLGCGYFSIAPANQLGDRFAIVTGVKCFEDMLQANIRQFSRAAAESGKRSHGLHDRTRRSASDGKINIEIFNDKAACS